ncbi:hypothetical protein RI578_21065 [Streptomyces sp. BB1-1-1]|uniref:hypothetical protein n=1 Tax=Streptomyces sp. BB1-1-1 TaxID=3074430 RepID=UPI002878054C|nr:hypothetical protein [Streptomyces sp. BB1-1-1]WND36622.1 hypothetical protein RI578_21065 [Streptomyces sp. BB1-1-1]
MSPAPHAAADARATRAGHTARAARTRRAARATRTGRRRACLRALVLLLVLIVPCTHATAQAAPTALVTGGSAGVVGGGAGGSGPGGGAPGGTVGEYDHLDTALRTPARSGRRTVVALSVPPPPTPGRHVPTPRTLAPPVPIGPPPSPRAPRSVVLRC